MISIIEYYECLFCLEIQNRGRKIQKLWGKIMISYWEFL